MRTVVIGDTSVLLAAIDDSHPDHEDAFRVVSTPSTLIVSTLVLTEADHLARAIAPQARLTFLSDVLQAASTGQVIVPHITTKSLTLAQSVILSYRGLDLDLTDAINVVLAAEYHTNDVATLDERDFRAIKPVSGHDHFRLLPYDL